MGKIKYTREIEEFIDKNKIFSVKDIKMLLASKNANTDYAYLLLHNLVKKGKLNRITKGYYSRYDDPMLIAYCIKPSYIGLENALSLHGLWEQETNVVLITPRKVRQNIRKVLGTNAVIHNIPGEYFFGYNYIDYYDLKIPVSDIEKTFIDLIFYKKYMDKELTRTFKKKIDSKRLKRYLKPYNKKIKDKVRDIIR
ncbi:hypothetical protein GF336_01905 [Candidatus Woesearchaeota archaeon]|nr:hypothetical protein [Candidatus Woesearchaeota archaeon]